jgi:hypothetical protein
MNAYHFSALLVKQFHGGNIGNDGIVMSDDDPFSPGFLERLKAQITNESKIEPGFFEYMVLQSLTLIGEQQT